MNIPILYEDEWLLALDKPAGLLTVPTRSGEQRTLTSIVNTEYRAPGAPSMYPCHRLDRETSGVIVFAKGRNARDRMMDVFKKGAVRKTYLAFVHGALPRPAGEISLPIEGKGAKTLFKVLETRDSFSVVEARPQTGRTNQIRIHFKYIGHPLVGETKFAFRKDFRLKFKRLCLHAAELEFSHPVTFRPIRIESPLPPDLAAFLSKPR